MKRTMLVSCGALLAALLLAPGARAANTAPTGFLAVTTVTGLSQLARFNLDGTHERVLTTGAANHYSPAVSPDGKTVLFEGEDGGGNNVYRMNIDGTGVTALTQSPALSVGPSWSADGSTILFAQAATGSAKAQIMRAKPDGAGPIALTHGTAGHALSPVESPDGQWVAFVQDSVETATLPDGSSGPQAVSRIWVMHASDGSGAHQVSAGPEDGYPAWAANDSLLFARSTADGKGSHIFSTNLSGTEKAESPDDLFLTEPRPQPDRKSYGATQQVASGGLRLVIVSRSDSQPIAMASKRDALMSYRADTTDAGYVIRPIMIGGGGDFFSIQWVFIGVAAATTPGNTPGIAVVHPPTTSSPVPVILTVGAVLVLLGVGFFLYRMTVGQTAPETGDATDGIIEGFEGIAAAPVTPPVKQVVHPPPVAHDEDKKLKKHCGPNAEVAFLKCLNATFTRLDQQFPMRVPGVIQGLGVPWMYEHGGDIDFRAQNTTSLKTTCPGPHCAGTISLCGKCHPEHVLSDMLYGFCCGFFGLGEEITKAGAYGYEWVARRGNVDEHHFSDAQPAYLAGVDLAKLQDKKGRENMIAPDDLCKVLSARGMGLQTEGVSAGCPVGTCVLLAADDGQDFSRKQW